jgi:hypothetical protein
VSDLSTSSRADRPPRAPAVYVVAGYTARTGTPVRFRLPLPPAWDDRPPGAWAAERRARKAYWAALDALATGRADRDAVGKAARLADDVRSGVMQATLQQLLRVFRLVTRAERPLLPAPESPWDRVLLGVPAGPAGAHPEALARRYAWTLEWLRTRRLVTARGLRVEWRVTAGDEVPVLRPTASMPAVPGPAPRRGGEHAA